MKVIKHYFDWADPASQRIFQNETGSFEIEERFHIQADNLIRNFALDRGGLFLDYGCGVGKHAICLKKKGCNVMGYDMSAYYIRKAKEFTAHEGVQLAFHHSTDFFTSFYGRFDFIYTIAFPFTYLDEGSIVSLFSAIKALLAEKGQFLFGFPYTRENREHFLPRNRWEEKNGLLYLTDEKMDEGGRRTERYMIIDMENDSAEEWVDETTYYYLPEIHEFLKRGGFTITGEFENLKKKAPDSPIDVYFLLCEPSL